MKLVLITCLLSTLFFNSVRAKDDVDNDISNPESLSSTTPINLDSNLRKALLRALSELEDEELSKDEGDSKTLFFSTTVRSPERIVEKASASAISILTNGNDEDTQVNTSTDSKDEEEQQTQKPIVIIQKSAGVQHRPIISVLNENNEETNEALSLSASSSFNGDTEPNKNYVRSSPKPNNLHANSVTVNDKFFTPGVKSVSITPKYDGVSTTLKPTTSTAENEAKVEDVQFFSAPLVAAFTVHQDERGLPSKVEPIYKQPGQTAISSSEIEDKQRQELLRQEEIKREQYRHQLAVQAKQKSLEEQVQNLQQQQKQQQEYLFRQQRIIQEQHLQHQRLIEEQHRFKNNDRPFVPILNNSPSTTERAVFFTTPSSGSSFNTFQNLPEVSPTSSNGNFNRNFGQNVQITTPNPLSISSSNSLAPNAPSFFQELPRTTPSPNFNSNLNQNQNQNRFNNNNFATNFNNLNSFNGNFKNNFNNLNNDFNKNSKFNNNNKFQNTVVSLQSSLSLSPNDLQSGKLPLNAQILPVRNAIDFHQSPNPNTHIDLRPPTVLNQQQQVFPNNFQQFPNNFVQNLPNNVRQGTRVFRQEPNTANFGFSNFNSQNSNNNFGFPQNPNTFSIQQSLEPPHRFFRANSESFQHAPGAPNNNAFQPNVNQQLNNLLYHSGITRNVRQNDDLHVVSKILSYNLGRDNLFAGSRVNEQRLASPKH